MKKCLIIAPFAGVGTNYAIDKLKTKYKIDKIDKQRDFYKIYPTPEAYQKDIIERSKKCDILIIPYFLEMDKRYLKGNIDYYVIYPEKKCKKEYIKRFIDLEFTKDQIKNFVDNWDAMIDDCETYKNKIVLKSKEYCLDYITKLLNNEEPLNEKLHLDTLLSKPNLYNKKIKLYRMGHVKDNKVYPFAKSVGNKLWKGDYCSWWAEQPDETMLHFLQQARLYLPDIKNKVFITVVPDDGRGYKRSVVFIPKAYFDENIYEFKKVKFYRYTKTFNVKDLHRGQEYAVSEWTCSDVVIPDRVETLRYKDCIDNGSVRIVSEDEFNDAKKKYPEVKYSADEQKKPWFYYEYSKVKELTKKQYNGKSYKEMTADDQRNLVNPKYRDIYRTPQEIIDIKLDKAIDTMISKKK